MSITEMTIKALLQQRTCLNNDVESINEQPQDYKLNGYGKEEILKYYYEELITNGDALAEFLAKINSKQISISRKDDLQHAPHGDDYEMGFMS